ncbi:polysaccharide biosynthesis tyrosine autokinase [Rhodocyclus purpureus]|uniref:polysaccharide biosynthesis tyrosine autokinase n=1 Tax=Rhodocyclus purpureus TaxID=1067 RepID=UPI0019121F74|nr:polysaccharide biosynthesis tyrosine autokinase [Rhodocyclus purpureus]MBK5914530.1 tyrosine protein kinase [Rhodocyclus purpureus]
MNLPNTSPLAQQPAVAIDDDEGGINLLGLLDIVIDQRWLIAGVTAAALALGGFNAYRATPIYEANTLIQIERAKGNPIGALVGGAGQFDVGSSVSADIEILRSRTIISEVVRNLQLDLSVSPKRSPVVGNWLARHASEPSDPGFLGMSGYVSGNESLQIGSFEVPDALRGHRFSVVLTASGYELRSSAGDVLGQGEFGQPLGFKHAGQGGELLVAGAVGKPGAEFFLSRSSLLGITGSLQGAVKITEQGKSSGILRVSLESPNPQLATRILNEIGALYVRQNTERSAAEAEKALSFLNTQLPQLRRELEASEDKFNEFRKQKGIFDLDSEASSTLGEGVNLRVKLFELQQKRKELGERFTGQHPAVLALDEQIKDLNARIGGLEGKAKSLPAVQQDLLRLTRDVKVNNELYTSLLDSFQQLRLVKEGKVGNVRVIDVAVVPEAPFKPDRGRMVALWGGLGLLAGLGLAFLRHRLRPGIRTADEIERELGLNVFATVPHSPAQVELAANIKTGKPVGHLLALAKPDEAAIESLRSLRTALQFAMLDASSNRVLITGPTPGIGKSFICANFAAVLAAAGKRVLLVDADLRKGHIHQFFDQERGHGLSELIAGSQPLDAVLRSGVAPQLDLITTGMLPPNPAELLMSPSTSALLESLSARYDLVLIDTPPVLAVADTAVLAPQSGTVFLVARAEVTSLGELQETSKRLAQSGVQVKGTIFNGLDLSKRRYGYGYGYKYKRYGYRYQAYTYGSGAQ